MPFSASKSPNDRRSSCSSTCAISGLPRSLRWPPRPRPTSSSPSIATQVIPKLISESAAASYAFAWLIVRDVRREGVEEQRGSRS